MITLGHYLWSITWDWTKRELTFILGIALGPILIGCPSILHYLLAFWSATDIVLSSWVPQESKGKVLWQEGETRIHLFDRFQMHRPAPKEWMSLGGVQLKQEFVGLMMKIGYFPNPFWEVPQKFADGSTDIARALNSKSIRVIKKRTQRSKNFCLGLLFCGFLFPVLVGLHLTGDLVHEWSRKRKETDRGWIFDWELLKESLDISSTSSCYAHGPEIQKVYVLQLPALMV